MNDELEQYLDLCEQIYLRLRAEGSWPWDEENDDQQDKNTPQGEDSENPKNVVDSKT